jgi:hypothetical protein
VQGAEPPTGRGGRGGGRGRGGRPFQAGHEEGPKSDVALEVTHIPPADNNPERLTTHFSKFGTVVSIQARAKLRLSRGLPLVIMPVIMRTSSPRNRSLMSMQSARDC